MEQFKIARQNILLKLTRLLPGALAEKKGDLTCERLSFLAKEFYSKKFTPFLTHPTGISFSRVLLHAMLTGDTDQEIDQRGWQVALQRFGLDSPIASVSKRLGMFGNTEDLLELIN